MDKTHEHFKSNRQKKTVILRAKNELDTQMWLSALLKHKFLIKYEEQQVEVVEEKKTTVLSASEMILRLKKKADENRRIELELKKQQEQETLQPPAEIVQIKSFEELER